MFVKQANIDYGPQQVNNGDAPNGGLHRKTRAHARTEKKSNPSKTNYWRQTMGNAANGWTPERRKKQSEAIKRWKPWKQPRGQEVPRVRRPRSATLGRAAIG